MEGGGEGGGGGGKKLRGESVVRGQVEGGRGGEGGATKEMSRLGLMPYLVLWRGVSCTGAAALRGFLLLFIPCGHRAFG